jgi:adenylate cyclase
MGDGLLAMFETANAASSASAGLRAAAGIGHALERFNQQLQAEGSQPVRIGMGLHLGDLVLGEIGAAKHAPRTIIGDAVNVASRLEAETKALGVELLVSDKVLDAAGLQCDPRDLREFSLRGVSEPVPALPVRHAADLKSQTSPLEQIA